MFRILIRRIGFYLVASAIFMFIMVGLFTIFYHFTEKLGWLDSFYFTVITTRTIGFGDITPSSQWGKLGTILNALVPATVFLGTSLVVLDGIMRQLEDFWRKYHMKQNHNHDIIVCDFDALDSILKEYAAAGRKYVVVSKVKEEDLPVQLQGTLDHGKYLQGDATRDETLEKAGIKKAASIIIATSDDSFNMYVLVTAKSLNPKLNKIVRINNAENSSKFTSVGADRVLPAATIIGQMLTQAAINPVSHRFLVALNTHTQDPFLEDIHPDRENIGKKVFDIYKRPIVLFRDGMFMIDIEEEELKEGDVIIKTHYKYRS